ncbi:flagellar brake protein [Desulfocurvus sp.]|uniref:flagellar brake protein n=1 Tax=Desulfocurvus sp. TaxID=2871698 RepID=UPI0025B925A0|nr:flagellar brake protein [Desulfocurvus sp.]MCK9239508.1 flagellar brake protein [Desulfocurvus sp.]
MPRNLNVSKLEGDALGITMGTVVLIEPQGLGDRFKTEFLGMAKGQFIIMRLPRIPGVGDHLYTEKRVTVRYMFQGNVYGFESEVLWTQSGPFRLLFLRYPSTVEVLNLRKCQRVDCYLPVRVGVGGDDQEQYAEYQGMMRNLSCGGCQVVLDAPDATLPSLAVDTPLNLDFLMIGTNRPVRLAGRAKNITMHKNRMVLGVMFDAVSDGVREGIESYVSSVADFLTA